MEDWVSTWLNQFKSDKDVYVFCSRCPVYRVVLEYHDFNVYGRYPTEYLIQADKNVAIGIGDLLFQLAHGRRPYNGGVYLKTRGECNV